MMFLRVGCIRKGKIEVVSCCVCLMVFNSVICGAQESGYVSSVCGFGYFVVGVLLSC